MLVYLDTQICIYFVEGPAAFQARAVARLAASDAAGDLFAISDLSWLECRMKPIRQGDVAWLNAMEMFLTARTMVRVPMPTPVFERACRIRAFHNFSVTDSLHLAAAVESNCDLFLTNDLQLSKF